MAAGTIAAPASSVGGGIFILFLMLIWLMFFVLAIIAFVFWIFMIVDVAKRKFKDENDKVVWILIVVLTGIIGALIYYFVIKRKDKKK